MGLIALSPGSDLRIIWFGIRFEDFEPGVVWE